MFSGEINDRKEWKKVKKNVFTTNVLVPKIAVIRKEEGATAAASHLPSPTQRNSAGSLDCRFAGRTGSVLPWSSPNHRENLINYPKCPTFDANRNAGDF